MRAPSFGLSGPDLHIIRSAVQKITEIEKVIVFGSRALGTYQPGSDVDLALVCSKNGPDCLRELSLQLNQISLLPYKFDLVLYTDQLESNFKAHIDRYGKIL